MIKPVWFKTKIVTNKNFQKVNNTISKYSIPTVCKEAKCPNIYECFSKGRVTFMILGNICTRNCIFCAVKKGIPYDVDIDEPKKVANAVKELELKCVVITSVTRDDLYDGGASIFSSTVREIKKLVKDCKIELLIPDFQGKKEYIDIIISARPDIISHNIETVERLYPIVRPRANYKISLNLLEYLNKKGVTTKSGIMVGLGENYEEIITTINDLYNTGCKILTIGQYLQPSKKNIKVARYVSLEEFNELKEYALKKGFLSVMSSPLVRSSLQFDNELTNS
jgi:lipoic acid synthetase